MCDTNRIAKALRPSAVTGDSAAQQALRKMAWVPLVKSLSKMTRSLCGLENLLEDSGKPHATGTLGDIASKALDDAILEWDGELNWIQYATAFVVAAIWDAVALATGLPKREVGGDIPAGARSPMAICAKLMRERRAELVELIRSTPTTSWADAGRTRRGWLVFLRKLGNALLCALDAVLVAAGIDWKRAWSVRTEILRMARSKASRDGRCANRTLAHELFNAAMIAIAFECHTYDPSRPFLPYAGKAAYHTMIAILDPARSDDDKASWLRIRAAIEALRDLLKREPKIGEIVKFLNAKDVSEWPKHETEAKGVAGDPDSPGASRKPAKGKFTARYVRYLMVVFGSDLQREKRRQAREIADGSAMATSGAEVPPIAEELAQPADRESNEELYDRAGLSLMEREVVELRRDDLSHPEIGEKLEMTGRKSWKTLWEAIDKLEAAAMHITAVESRILTLKFIALKSDNEIEEELGVERSKIEVLLSRVRWKLRKYPDLRVELTAPEWSALNLALSEMSHEQIAFHMDRPLPEVASLLEHAVRKVLPHDRENNPTTL